jgi:hypothetical protein
MMMLWLRWYIIEVELLVVRVQSDNFNTADVSEMSLDRVRWMHLHIISCHHFGWWQPVRRWVPGRWWDIDIANQDGIQTKLASPKIVHKPSLFSATISDWVSNIHSWPWGAERLMNRRVKCSRVSLMVWSWLDSHSQKLHPSGSVFYTKERDENGPSFISRDWCQAWYLLECAAFITALISIGNCNLVLVSMPICHEAT